MKNLEPYAVEQKADLETNINVYVNYYRFENGYEVETSEKPFSDLWDVRIWDSMGNKSGKFKDQSLSEVMDIIDAVALHEDNFIISDEALDDWDLSLIHI